MMKVAPESQDLDRDEFRTLLERRCRNLFDMSLDEFVVEFRAGRLDQYPLAYDLAMLAGVEVR